jgi:hypothetical protein
VDKELDYPLGDPPGRVPVEDDIIHRSRCDDLDRVLMEVRGQSSLGPEHRVDQLLEMWVPFSVSASLM